jgi:hypothetical protein
MSVELITIYFVRRDYTATPLYIERTLGKAKALRKFGTFATRTSNFPIEFLDKWTTEFS